MNGTGASGPDTANTWTMCGESRRAAISISRWNRSTIPTDDVARALSSLTAATWPRSFDAS